MQNGTSPGPRSIVFIGDSITEQWSRRRRSFFAKHGFVNRGIGGQTTRQIRARFLDDIRQAGAGAIHLMCGLNDIAENEGPVPLSLTQDNLAWMIDRGLETGGPMLVGSVTPADTLAWNPRVQPADRIVALNEWLRAYATNHNAKYIDYHAVLRTPTNGLRAKLGPDGSHLDARGYRLIEPVLLAAIAERLGRIPRARSSLFGRLATVLRGRG